MLLILFTASDNRVQHPGWTVVSDSLVKDLTCGGKIFSPHASDCHKYYLCQFGVLTEQTCPAGLHWNKVNCKLLKHLNTFLLFLTYFIIRFGVVHNTNKQMHRGKLKYWEWNLHWQTCNTQLQNVLKSHFSYITIHFALFIERTHLGWGGSYLISVYMLDIFWLNLIWMFCPCSPPDTFHLILYSE